jgi:ubiquitin C-terminal hydrolase
LKISSFFKDPNHLTTDFIHKTVNILKNLDETDEKLNANMPSQFANNSPQEQTSTFAYGTGKMATSLNECFELFTQTEELSDENSWKCSKCKQQTNAYKNLCISKAPPILIIHLKRFFYKSKTSNFKLTTPVWFPVTSLDISKYVAGSRDSVDDLNNGYDTAQKKPSTSDYIYDLFAVCNHKGQNMASGHYTGRKSTIFSKKQY